MKSAESLTEVQKQALGEGRFDCRVEPNTGTVQVWKKDAPSIRVTAHSLPQGLEKLKCH